MIVSKVLAGKVERVELEDSKTVSTVRFAKNDLLHPYESIRIIGDLGIGTEVNVTVSYTDTKNAGPLEQLEEKAARKRPVEVS